MWKSFALERHGEWSQFADECTGLIQEPKNLIAKSTAQMAPFNLDTVPEVGFLLAVAPQT